MVAAVIAERDLLKHELVWTKQDLAAMRQSLHECLGALRELQTAIRMRRDAETEVRRLHRERSIARAQAAERDPAAPLQ